MNKEDVIKYSQQIVLYKSSKDDYFIANGFFVRYKAYFYFATVNHAIEPESNYNGDAHLILHINGNDLTTKTKKITNWQFVDLYKFPDDKEKYTFPIFNYREDFAFCSITKENIKENITTLPYFLSNAKSASCQYKKFNCIQLPKQLTEPDYKKAYYVAGKILEQSNGVRWSDIEYCYDMKYHNKVCDIYEFKIRQSVNTEQMKGLSGSPVFDENMQFVGMALRYMEEDNILRVFPAKDIECYLKNDCIPSQEMDDYN